MSQSDVNGNAPIELVMSKPVVSVGAEITVADARSRMAHVGVRHLPVVRNDEVVAVVSARDMLWASEMRPFIKESTPLGELISRKPVSVEPSTPLRDVLQLMMKEDIGAVVVIDEGDLVGIFTDVDAMVTLDRLLG